MQRSNIVNYYVTERLRDGKPVTIRAIRPNDKGRMVDALREASLVLALISCYILF